MPLTLQSPVLNWDEASAFNIEQLHALPVQATELADAMRLDPQLSKMFERGMATRSISSICKKTGRAYTRGRLHSLWSEGCGASETAAESVAGTSSGTSWCETSSVQPHVVAKRRGHSKGLHSLSGTQENPSQNATTPTVMA